MPATRSVRMAMASLILSMSPHLSAAPAFPEPAAGPPVARADLEQQLASADRAFKDQDFEAAAGILTQALPHDPDGRVRERLVAVRFQLGQTDQALHLAHDATAPLGVPHALAIATHLARDDHWPPALQLIERLLAAHPDDPRIAYLRGVLLHHTQPHTAAATQQFLAVLDLHAEVPNAPAPAATDGLLPPGAAALARQARAQERALSALNFHQPPPGHYEPFIHLPTTLTDAHDLAIAWLRLRAVELDSPALETLITQLEARGQPLARLLLHEPPVGDRRPQLTPEVFAQYPNHPDLLGAAVTHGVWEHDGLKREQLTVAAEIFTNERPALALHALIQLRALDITQGHPASAAIRWDPIARLLERLDTLPHSVLPRLASLLKPTGRDGEALDAEQRRALGATLERTYPGPQPDADWITQHESTLFALYAQDGRWNDFARLLTDIARAAPSPDTPPLSATFSSLSYPPRGLHTVPDKLHPLFKATVNALNHPAIDHAALRQALPPDTTPALRALTAAAANDPDALQAVCAAAPPTNIAPRMIQAAWLTRHTVNVERQPVAAADALAPLAGPHTDGALVNYATEALDQNNPLSPATGAAARQAALRLRGRPFKDPHFDRLRLADALETLGLPEPAADLRAEIEALPIPDANQKRRRQHYSQQSPRADRIQKLLANNQRDEAVAAAALAARSLSQHLILGNPYTNPPAPELLRLIHAAGLTDDVIAHLRPPAGSPEPQRLVFAGVLEQLGLIDAAIVAYQRCIDARPTASPAARLAMLLLDRDGPAAAADALTRLPPVEQSRLRQRFGHSLNKQHHDDPRRVIPPAQMATHWIENAPDPTALRASWITSLFGPLAQTRFVPGADGLHLHHAAARKLLTQPNTPHPLDLTLYRERVAAHDRLARAALRVPALAEQAANFLVLSAQLEDRPLGPSIDTLQRAATAPQPNPLPIDSWGYAASGPGIVRLRPPLETLAAFAARHAQPQRMRTTADTLRSQNRTGEADHLERLYALYHAPAPDFIPAAENFIEQVLASQAASHRHQPPPLASVIDAWASHPTLPPDLGSLILRFSQEQDANRHDAKQLGIARRYAQSLAARSGRDAASAWFQQLSDAYFGSDETRDALIADARPNANDENSRRVEAFIRMLNRAALDPQIIWIALDQLEAFHAYESRIPHHQQSHTAHTTTLLNALERATLTAQHPVRDLTQILAHSPLLGSAHTFRAGRRTKATFASDGRPGRSLIDALRHHVATDDTPFTQLLRNDIARWIDQQPPTLGTAVTGAALHNLGLADTLQRLAPHQSEIANLTPPQRQELLAALPALPTPLPDLSPAASAIARNVSASRPASAAARAKHLLTPTFRRHEQGSHRHHTALVFELLAEDDIPTAARLMTMWGSDSRGHFVRHFGYSEGRTNNDLWRTLREYHPSPAPPAACLRLVTTLSTNTNFGMPGGSDQKRFVDDQFDRLHAATAPDSEPDAAAPAPDPAAFFAILDQLQPALGDDPTAALLLGLAKLAEQTHPDADALPASATRLNKLPPSDLHRTARAALNLAQARRHKADDHRPAPNLHILDAYLTTAADKDTLSPSLRLGLLSNVLAAVDPQALPEACAAAAQRLNDKTPRGWGTSHFGLADPEIDRILDPLITAAFTLPPGTHDAPIIQAYVDWAGRNTWSETSSPTSIRLPRTGQTGCASPRLGSPGPALQILDRALHTRQLPQAMRLLNAQEERLATSPAAWLVLARHGHANLAAAFIRKHHAAARPALVTVPGYDIEAADAVLEELNDTSDLRFFAQAALAVLAGPDVPDVPAPLTARRARLVALAQQFSTQTFSTPALRRATLLMLTRAAAATGLLREPLEDATQHLTLASAYVNYHDTTGRELRYATLVAGLRTHHLTRLHAELDRVFPPSGATGPQGHRTDEIRRDVLHLIRDHLGSDHGLSLDQLSELAPTFQRLMTAPPLQPYHRHGKSDLRTLWVLTLLDRHAEPGAFETWYASRPEFELRPESRPDPDDLRPQLKTILLQPSVTAPRRRAVLSRFVNSAPSDQQADLLQSLVSDDALLSNEEAAEIAPEQFRAPAP